MKRGDKVRVGQRGGVGVAEATCELAAFCEEPNRGLLEVREVRDSCPEHAYRFTVPYAWWDSLVVAEQEYERQPVEYSPDVIRQHVQLIVDDLLAGKRSTEHAVQDLVDNVIFAYRQSERVRHESPS